MTIRTTYAAEAWDKVYSAFQQINFTSYDYDTVKESLLQYLKIYHAEHFNDFIESSELIAILEMFAYVAELLAYRVDTMSHENFITTAQRKQSILRLARLISYRASRNIPARGLVKINTVRTTEDVFDSLGNNLANVSVQWNDPNNTNWKEQFFLVINKSLTSRFGQPSKSFQIADVLMQLYTFNNEANAFRNGVFSFNATDTGMEAVPIDIDENGPYERAPDLNSQFNLVYASDGKGDGSDYTGFLLFVKQGTLTLTNYTITEPTSNRRIELNPINVNDTDVWVYRVDDAGAITENWSRVETLNEQNLVFNDSVDSRKKFEIETLENDQIAILFGDNNFSDAPVGNFQFWTRQSLNENVMIPRNRISGQQMSFGYFTQANVKQEFNLTFSLTAAIQNNSVSETIEHIRQAAPSTYYAQNRMVNGQDYNTYPLKDPTILRLKTINRTFAGQPKYIEWNDASRSYENTKLFGDDLTMYLDVSVDAVETRTSAKGLIDSFIEPLLQSSALLNVMTHVMSTSEGGYGIISYPRRKFIEDNRNIYFNIDGSPVDPYGTNSGNGSLNEKTAIQGALDQHWFGEPISFATINGIRHAVISDPILNPRDDGNIYISDIPRTIDGQNTYPPGDTGSGLQSIQQQPYFGLRYNRFLSSTRGVLGAAGTMTILTPTLSNGFAKREVITIEMTSDSTTFTVISNLRGRLPNYSLDLTSNWADQTSETVPINFVISNSQTNPFIAGDAFIIDITNDSSVWTVSQRTFGNNLKCVNLSGWWEIISAADLQTVGIANPPTLTQQMTFDQGTATDSWIFLVSRKDDSSGNVESWNIYNRNMKIIAESPSTKFWYNQNDQIIDSVTKKVVRDKIRILRSNLDETGTPLKSAQIYDTINFVYDSDGVIKTNSIEIFPSEALDFTAQINNSTPENVLQFELFSENSYQYGYINADGITITWLPCGSYELIRGYDIPEFDYVAYDSFVLKYQGTYYSFTTGSFVGSLISGQNASQTFVRRMFVPSPTVPTAVGNTPDSSCNNIKGLDFLWQHFSPITNLIDPSVTNIHDAFIMTSGYYNNVINYVKGFSDINPQPPTPLDLRTSYGYLLKNKMLSDTVVLHSGKIKLLFGAKADQRLRAKFRVVKSPSATFSDERIKSEMIAVIDAFFNISNWDFGEKFYATKLISLFHQRLSTQISSVVLVPTYSVNSFGSLFTIDSGFDEILQSAASINDVEIVDALTPTVLRQIR